MIKVDKHMSLEKAKKVLSMKRYYHQEIVRKAMDVIKNERRNTNEEK